MSNEKVNYSLWKITDPRLYFWNDGTEIKPSPKYIMELKKDNNNVMFNNPKYWKKIGDTINFIDYEHIEIGIKQSEYNPSYNLVAIKRNDDIIKIFYMISIEMEADNYFRIRYELDYWASFIDSFPRQEQFIVNRIPLWNITDENNKKTLETYRKEIMLIKDDALPVFYGIKPNYVTSDFNYSLAYVFKNTKYRLFPVENSRVDITIKPYLKVFNNNALISIVDILNVCVPQGGCREQILNADFDKSSLYNEISKNIALIDDSTNINISVSQERNKNQIDEIIKKWLLNNNKPLTYQIYLKYYFESYSINKKTLMDPVNESAKVVIQKIETTGMSTSYGVRILAPNFHIYFNDWNSKITNIELNSLISTLKTLIEYYKIEIKSSTFSSFTNTEQNLESYKKANEQFFLGRFIVPNYKLIATEKNFISYSNDSLMYIESGEEFSQIQLNNNDYVFNLKNNDNKKLIDDCEFKDILFSKYGENQGLIKNIFHYYIWLFNGRENIISYNGIIDSTDAIIPTNIDTYNQYVNSTQNMVNVKYEKELYNASLNSLSSIVRMMTTLIPSKSNQMTLFNSSRGYNSDINGDLFNIAHSWGQFAFSIKTIKAQYADVKNTKIGVINNGTNEGIYLKSLYDAYPNGLIFNWVDYDTQIKLIDFYGVNCPDIPWKFDIDYCGYLKLSPINSLINLEWCHKVIFSMLKEGVRISNYEEQYKKYNS